MGNVFAATAVQPLNPGNIPGFPSTADQPKPESNSENVKVQLNNNPGSMDELHRKCKEIFPMPFDGGKVIVNKILSNHFQISHNFTLSSGMTAPPGYRFGATYIGTKQISPSEAYPIFLGDMDPNGNLDSHIIHLFGDRLKVNLAAQFQNSKCTTTQLKADLLGPDFTASVGLGNIDLINDSGLTIAGYLQNITNRLSMGAELVCQYNRNNAFSLLSLAGRYTSPDNYIVSGVLNQNSVQLCYYQKKNEFLQVGVQVDTNLAQAESSASFGYQIDIPKSNFVFRGYVDSNWNVGAVFEKKLLPMPLTLIFSGIMNHVRSRTRVGLGLVVG